MAVLFCTYISKILATCYNYFDGPPHLKREPKHIMLSCFYKKHFVSICSCLLATIAVCTTFGDVLSHSRGISGLVLTKHPDILDALIPSMFSAHSCEQSTLP